MQLPLFWKSPQKWKHNSHWEQTWWEPFWYWIICRKTEKILQVFLQVSDSRNSCQVFTVDSSRKGEMCLQATCYVYVLRLRSLLLKLPTAKLFTFYVSDYQGSSLSPWGLPPPTSILNQLKNNMRMWKANNFCSFVNILVHSHSSTLSALQQKDCISLHHPHHPQPCQSRKKPK